MVERIECDVGAAGGAAEVQGWPPPVGGGGLEARDLHQGKLSPPQKLVMAAGREASKLSNQQPFHQ